MIFDSVVFDGKSMFILLDEFEKYFRDKTGLKEHSQITFRDYAAAFAKKKSGKKYEEDRDYYTARLEKLKKLPEFYGIQPGFKEHVISHHRYIANAGTWKRFRKICAENHITAH